MGMDLPGEQGPGLDPGCRKAGVGGQSLQHIHPSTLGPAVSISNTQGQGDLQPIKERPA